MSPGRVSRCSTPFGITEVGTSPVSAGLFGAGVPPAQRLSASQRSAQYQSSSSIRTVHRYVLNAFRHHRGRHDARILACGPWLSPDRCSTPFGITEVVHLRWCVLDRCSPLCAQRLSASLRSAHRFVDALRWTLSTRAQRLSASLRSAHASLGPSPRPAGSCSTPFGITEVGTLPDRGACPSRHGAQRLSASLRSAHVGKLRIAAHQCAQRLSASLRSAHCRYAQHCGCTIRAQRLSASLRSAHQAIGRECRLRRVLNAFRHH